MHLLDNNEKGLKMKNHLILIITLFCVICIIFFVSCTNSDNNDTDYAIDIQKTEINTTSNSIIEQTLTPEVSVESSSEYGYYPLPTDDDYRDEEGNLINNVKLIDNGDTYRYINERAGYSIDFPAEYINFLMIVENEEYNETEFHFYGKSALGRGWVYYYDQYPTVGIFLFSIANEEILNSDDISFSDNNGCIGTINKQNYYLITSTDVSISPLLSEVRYIEEGVSYFQEDEKEKELIISDLEIADKISSDLYIIVNTFASLD